MTTIVGCVTRVCATLTVETEPNSPAFALTSCNHWSSPSLFFPPRPHRLTNSCFSSSHTSRSRVLWLIPFSAANRSHFVGGFGLGRGFSRGNSVVGGGGRKTGPTDVVCVGKPNKLPRRVEVEASVSDNK